VQWAVVIGALLLIWNSLGDHALLPPDEGRYGSVAAWMAEQGDWLAPRIRDQVHVTKPPLTYWAQGLCVLALGRTELAVRLPSAIGASIVVLALFWFARRTWGPLVAVIAVGAYAVMPLSVVCGRLGTTDSLLNAWWWLALCFGCMALAPDARGEGSGPAPARTGWIVAFWAATALIGLTKGPLVVAPLLLILAWLVLAGRWRAIWRTHLALGLPLALVPLAVVGYLYWQANPARTAAIWHDEFVDRVTHGGVHRDPIWLLVPVFLVGLLPASASILPEAIKRGPRWYWSLLRGGSPAALMLLAVVLPFVGFSLLSGKLPTYLLPLAAPCSIVFALVLAPWLDGRTERPGSGARPGEVRVAAWIGAAVLALGAPAAAAVAVRLGDVPDWAPGWTAVRWSLLFVPAGLGWFAFGWFWRAPAARGVSLGCAFVGMVAMWLGIQVVENRAIAIMDSRPVAEYLRARDVPALAVALKDLTIDYYWGRWTDFADEREEIDAWLAAHPDGLVLIGTRRGDLRPALDTSHLAGLREVLRQDAWPFKKIVVYERERESR
jgi:4-amino-4-deoxy-L-arabinose transferase-like glycosyltransferase